MPVLLIGRDGVLAEARRAIQQGRQLLLVGTPGSGRTSVLRVLEKDLDDVGRPHHLLAGHDSIAGIPLAAAAPLVTATGLDADLPLGAYTRLPPVLKAAGAIVLVDDVDLVDRASAVLVAQLARAGVQLILTAPTVSAVPRSIRDLLTSAAWVIVPLPELSADEVLALAAAELGDELDVPSAAGLVVSSEGLPERVVELLRAGRDGLEAGPGGISLGPARLTELLRRRVAERLGGLSTAARKVVELVSVAEEIPQDALSAPAVDEAVAAGVLLRSTRGAAILLSPRDDVLRAAVVETLGGATALLRRREAHALLAPRAGSAPQRALVAVAAGDVSIDVDELLDAAAELLRRHRPTDAWTLLEHCPDHGDPRLLLLRGTAHSALGRLDAATRELATAARVAPVDLLPEVGRELGLLHAVRRASPAAAVVEVTALVERLGPGAAAGQRLSADLVKWRLMAGLPPGEVPGADQLTAAVERIGVAVIAAMVGCLDGPLPETADIVSAGLAEVAASPGAPPYSADLLTLSRYLVLAFGGQVEAAEALARRQREEALESRHPAVGMWEYATAELGLHTGQVVHSRNLARRAVRHLTWQDFTGLRESALALLAALESRCGDEGAASRARLELSDTARADVKVDLHLARHDAQRLLGQAPDDAARIIATAGRRALAESHAHLGLVAIDEALLVARDPGLRCELAGLLAAEAYRSPLFAALAGRAQAELAADARALEEAAGELAAVGLHGRAAQALLSAASYHDDRGAREAAQRVRASSTAACSTRGVLAWPDGDNLARLSRRELEIAWLAAGRARSKEIAATLDLSVRTVDNHLARIYRKLGVTRRDELAGVLGSSATRLSG